MRYRPSTVKFEQLLPGTVWREVSSDDGRKEGATYLIAERRRDSVVVILLDGWVTQNVVDEWEFGSWLRLDKRLA